MSFNLVLCKSELKFIYCSFDSISSPVIPPWIKLFESRLLSMFNEIKFGLKYWSLMRQNLFFGQYTKKNMCKLTIDIFSHIQIDHKCFLIQNLSISECSKALNGHTVYVSSDGINHARSVELKRDTNSSTNNSHSSHHYTCYHGHSYYRGSIYRLLTIRFYLKICNTTVALVLE